MRHLLLLLLLPLASALVNGTVSLTASIPTGGNDTVIKITNDLGPTAVVVQFGASQVEFTIFFTSGSSAGLDALIAAQPAAPTVIGNEISLDLLGATFIAATDLGDSCKLEKFSATSPRPPCMPLAFTPTSSPPPGSANNSAYVIVSVPEETTVCVNSFCTNPLYYAVPGISPVGFIDLGNGAVYDRTQALMWQKQLLPDEYPYVSFPDKDHDNFDPINRAAQACYALRTGGYSDWRLPTRGELHRWADHSVSPAQNWTFFPNSTKTKDEAYWTVIRSKVNDYLGVYLMQYGGDGGITYNGDVGYSPIQRARCVRTVINKLPPVDRFAVTTSAEAALDHWSGLIWQVNPVNTEYPNAGGAALAIAECDALIADGQSDWRLPNNKEMNSFMDESRAGPAWNITVFPNFSGANSWWWCSNNNVAFGSNYWWGWSGSDGVSYVNVSPGRARCVRGPDFDNLSTCPGCPSTPTGVPSPPPSSKSGGGLSGGAKAGIAIGVIAIVALLAVGGFLVWKYGRGFIENKRSSRLNISV